MVDAEKVAAGPPRGGGRGSRAIPSARGLAVRFDVIAEHAGRIQHVPDAF